MNEDEGEDCMDIILDYITSLGFESASMEVENVHRIGKKRQEKPRPIIAKLYSRPFKRKLLQGADSKQISFCMKFCIHPIFFLILFTMTPYMYNSFTSNISSDQSSDLNSSIAVFIAISYKPYNDLPTSNFIVYLSDNFFVTTNGER